MASHPHRCGSVAGLRESFLFVAGLTVAGTVGGQNLLTNPDFADALAGWEPVGNRARYSHAAGAGPGGTSAARYHKEEAETPGENSRLDQVASVAPGRVYVAGLQVRTATPGLRPVLRLADRAYATLAWAAAAGGGDWEEVKLVFRAGPNDREVRWQLFGGALGEIRQTEPGTAFFAAAFLRPATAAEEAGLRQAVVRLDADSPRRPIPPLFFGANALFMVEDDAGLAGGALAARLRTLPCRLLRYPGGDVADNYLWRTHSLDDPAWWPARQGPETTDTDEFMAFCRAAGAEPILVVNLETWLLRNDLEAGARHAADWVRYCNRDKGHAVRYWEIGNETYLYNPGPEHRHKRLPVTARQYAEAYARFRAAMRAVDPDILCGAIGPVAVQHFTRLGTTERDAEAWWPTVFEACAGEVDFVVVHAYFPATYGQPVGVAAGIESLRAFLDERLPGRRLPLALTEWNLNRNAAGTAVEGALLVAEGALEYLRSGVDMACFWPLRYQSAWGQRALLTHATHEPLPRFAVLQMLAEAAGMDLIPCSSSNPLIHAAGAAAGRNRVVFCISRDTGPEPVGVHLALPTAGEDAVVATALVPAGDGSDALVPATLPVVRAPDGWRFDLPPRSMVRLLVAGSPVGTTAP